MLSVWLKDGTRACKCIKPCSSATCRHASLIMANSALAVMIEAGCHTDMQQPGGSTPHEPAAHQHLQCWL